MQPRFIIIGAVLALAACGGGGGDPGTCHGSPEVCAEGQSTTAAPTRNTSTTAGAPAPAPAPNGNGY
jgi:hypothetical protein